jgi:hypothetical protein
MYSHPPTASTNMSPLLPGELAVDGAKATNLKLGASPLSMIVSC